MSNECSCNTYVNPILDSGADPWMIMSGGFYYLCNSDGDRRIYLIRTDQPQNLRYGEKTYVYCAPEGTDHSCETWAPELHFIRGRWYIYYASDDGRNENHRMFVLEGGSNPDNPLDGEFRFASKIADDTDRWAIDGTVLQWKDELYFIWSGWEGYVDEKQNIYIALMSNPWTICGEKVLISTPDREWEQNGHPLVNEGPEVLIQGETIHIIYSASGSWTNDYCLGRLTCNDGNVLNPSSWKKTGPVFSKTETVFGPGHASFIKSMDGSKDYIVYHAAVRDGAGWDRNIRLQSFNWDGNIPAFGSPVSEGVQLEGLG
jgi:GH43 family beta-xylosidase